MQRWSSSNAGTPTLICSDHKNPAMTSRLVPARYAKSAQTKSNKKETGSAIENSSGVGNHAAPGHVELPIERPRKNDASIAPRLHGRSTPARLERSGAHRERETPEASRQGVHESEQRPGAVFLGYSP